ncbi:hypothetical protein [Streptococcus oricebi]|uniref:DUF1433 domain-containing protein n=1 Tax=Streptococcus oricebi TaxID=1547447 RepID=A0ABS5B659_9STRE|nr:hypothetical protein [Streptococcus oricebi]MBP2624295.1 hypothetical protein [Streptococcus oricebi]
MKSKKIWLLLIPVVILVIVGGFMLKQKMEEEKRNREYEVSLVKALKNSYAGIEEIRISDPYYTDKPGSWSCDVEMKFKDNTIISYGINHSLDDKVNHDGVVKGNTNAEINKQWEILHSREGKTIEKVIVYYSDNEKGEQ